MASAQALALQQTARQSCEKYGAEPAKLLSRMVRRIVLKGVGALWVGVSPPRVGMICRVSACTCWVSACESVTR